MSAARPYFVTTPIYYVNDLPHLGHAYPTVAADVLARFMRLDGRRVKFLTGTDEHGQKVERSAEALGLTPRQFANQVSAAFRDMDRLLDISNDDYIRTTEPRHVRGVQALWQELERRGEIYLGRFAGWYCVRDEAFYDESELVDGPGGKKAPTGAEVEWLEEENYFFRLSAWQDRLLAWYEANPDAVAPPSRRNEVISFVRGGLKDLSISRTSFSWGIPVPADPRHVIYVWLDALANYITALGYPETETGAFKEFWPADVHVVGKDILRFHAVYWPAFLMAAGLEPPRRVFAHGWWTIEGQKMSKSLGNGIPPDVLVGKYGVDPARYFLLRELPFGSDGDFSHRAVVGRLNADLANDFGNLAQRVLAMINRNCDGAVPQPGPLDAADEKLLAGARSLLDHMRRHIEAQAFHLAIDTLWRIVADTNRYVDEQAPWALRRTDPARMRTVLYVLAETLRHLGIMAQPFVPEASGKLLDQLAVPATQRDFAALAAMPLEAGMVLPKPEGIFPRFVETDAAAET
ncbi:MAG: methionine--tRNA ligase [Alphaproteobacteria bacterium]|nr:methionine--tRNA ligase [Alphaproteobacteria bacterium]